MNTSNNTCSECGTSVSTGYQSESGLLDYGWSFNYLSLGHYGGFSDSLPDSSDKYDDPKYLIYLCHDCCIKMIDALPNAFSKALGNLGCHPRNIGERSCCRYAWTVDSSGFNYRGDGEGGWILVRAE